MKYSRYNLDGKKAVKNFPLNKACISNVILSNIKSFGARIIDLSKSFNSLNHNLHLTKLKDYRLDNNSVEFFRRYISNRY